MEPLIIALKNVCSSLYGSHGQLDGLEPSLTRTDEQFGDYTTNLAMQLAPLVSKNPREVAEALISHLNTDSSLTDVESFEIAGPGFINIRLKDQAVYRGGMQATVMGEAYGSHQQLNGQQVVAEYSDPNPFKVLHAGHLYTSVVGDAIANLLQAAGASVHRVTFGGDIGRHVAITMWVILRRLEGENPEALHAIAEHERAEWLAQCYVEGTNAFEDNPDVKEPILELNKRLYAIIDQNDHDSPLAVIYWTTRQWSYDYFDAFYDSIGTIFERNYPESEIAQLGLDAVRSHIGSIFKESDGAIVFDGEAHGLHTRVFINSQGLPTYETKDIGLILTKKRDYNFDKSVVITGNEQADYMKVVLAALKQFEPELADATTHLTHGIVKLTGGTKMSSRKGNILRATDVLDAAREASKAVTNETDEKVVLGAVKYAFLKHRIGGDIIYDPAESVSIHGNSGPYLQYALVRAKSILRKATDHTPEAPAPEHLEAEERSLARKISEWPETVQKATQELAPHVVSVYLYELAQIFNRFYESSPIIGHDRQALRLSLGAAYVQTLENGLRLLGMPIPEHM